MRISINLPRAIGLMLLLLGAAGLLVSIIYSSSIVAPIGLGLIFWGIIMFYIQSEEYVKKTVLNSTSTTLLTSLDEMLRSLDYKGKAIYLPPKYLNDAQSTKVYIPKLQNVALPSPDVTQELEMQPTPKNAQGVLVTPPGSELAQLLETELGTSLLRIGLKDLPQRLPKALIEDLEVMTDCDIQTSTDNTTEKSIEAQTNQNTILVRFTTTAFKETCREATRLSMIFSNIGCPLSSVFAIAFVKATGKPISITAQNVSEDGEKNETEYTIVEESTA
jgi:hypothetical protein